MHTPWEDRKAAFVRIERLGSSRAADGSLALDDRIDQLEEVSPGFVSGKEPDRCWASHSRSRLINHPANRIQAANEL